MRSKIIKNKKRVSKRTTPIRWKTTKMWRRERHKLPYRKWRAHHNGNRQKWRRSSSTKKQLFLKNHWLKHIHTKNTTSWTVCKQRKRMTVIVSCHSCIRMHHHNHNCWKWNIPLFKKLNLKSFYTTSRILNFKWKISKKLTNYNLMISRKQVKNWQKTKTKKKWRRKPKASRKISKWTKKIQLQWKW